MWTEYYAGKYSNNKYTELGHFHTDDGGGWTRIHYDLLTNRNNNAVIVSYIIPRDEGGSSWPAVYTFE